MNNGWGPSVMVGGAVGGVYGGWLPDGRVMACGARGLGFRGRLSLGPERFKTWAAQRVGNSLAVTPIINIYIGVGVNVVGSTR